MNESQKLAEWMRLRCFDYATLAEATGDSYASVYMMATGRRPVNESFKWRFAIKFGWYEARSLFVEPSPEPQPA